MNNNNPNSGSTLFKFPKSFFPMNLKQLNILYPPYKRAKLALAFHGGNDVISFNKNPNTINS